jgi:hypothetical protein
VVYILTCPADAARDRAANAPWGPRIIATAPIESVSITGLTMLSRHITDALLRPERIAERLSQSRPAVLSPGQGARLAITRPGTRASDVRRVGPIVSERTAFTPSIGAWIGPSMQISWRRQSGKTHLCLRPTSTIHGCPLRHMAPARLVVDRDRLRCRRVPIGR